MGDVNIGAQARVTFADKVRNASDDGAWVPDACNEALYVEVLRIDRTASLVLDNCKVYYRELDDPDQRLNAAQRIGCGQAIRLLPVPAVTQWGLAVMALLIIVAATVLTRRRLSHG